MKAQPWLMNCSAQLTDMDKMYGRGYEEQFVPAALFLNVHREINLNMLQRDVYSIKNLWLRQNIFSSIETVSTRVVHIGTEYLQSIVLNTYGDTQVFNVTHRIALANRACAYDFLHCEMKCSDCVACRTNYEVCLLGSHTW